MHKGPAKAMILAFFFPFTLSVAKAEDMKETVERFDPDLIFLDLYVRGKILPRLRPCGLREVPGEFISFSWNPAHSLIRVWTIPASKCCLGSI